MCRFSYSYSCLFGIFSDCGFKDFHSGVFKKCPLVESLDLPDEKTMILWANTGSALLQIQIIHILILFWRQLNCTWKIAGFFILQPHYNKLFCWPFAKKDFSLVPVARTSWQDFLDFTTEKMLWCGATASSYSMRYWPQEMQHCGSCSALSGGGTCDRDACKIYIQKLLFVEGFGVVVLF